MTVLSGTARLDADRTVTVIDGADGGAVAQGTNVILAPGSVPRTLPGFDVDGSIVVTSDEFLDLTPRAQDKPLTGLVFKLNQHPVPDTF